MSDDERRLTPREALDELERLGPMSGTSGRCQICEYDTTPSEGGPKPYDHHPGCPVAILRASLHLEELAGDSIALKVRRLELGTGAAGPGTGPHHASRIETLERIYGNLNEGLRLRIDLLEGATKNRVEALETGLATALGAGLLDRVAESRLQSLEERIVGLEADVESRLQSVDVRIQALEIDLQERTYEGPETAKETWAGRRVAVSRRALICLKALHPTHVLSPVYEKIVGLASDPDQPTKRLEELQQAAEGVEDMYASLEGGDPFGRNNAIADLAGLLRKSLSEELER